MGAGQLRQGFGEADFPQMTEPRAHVLLRLIAARNPQKPIPQPAPTPPGLPPHKDIEQRCVDRYGDVNRDFRSVAKIVHGNITGSNYSYPFPGVTITPQPQSFATAVSRLEANGFTEATVLGFQSSRHPEGDGYQKLFGDGLWMHAIVNYPHGLRRSDSIFAPRPDFDPRWRTPSITVHCHATDPTGLDHIINSIP